VAARRCSISLTREARSPGGQGCSRPCRIDDRYALARKFRRFPALAPRAIDPEDRGHGAQRGCHGYPSRGVELLSRGRPRPSEVTGHAASGLHWARLSRFEHRALGDRLPSQSRHNSQKVSAIGNVGGDVGSGRVRGQSDVARTVRRAGHDRSISGRCARTKGAGARPAGCYRR
jgi:hypothetical protein